jgi:hypothetical protein
MSQQKHNVDIVGRFAALDRLQGAGKDAGGSPDLPQLRIFMGELDGGADVAFAKNISRCFDSRGEANTIAGCCRGFLA